MAEQNRKKRPYSDPTPVQATILSSACALAGDPSHPDWELNLVTHIRNISTVVRSHRYRDIIDTILTPDASAFVAVVRGLEFHENSQRFIIQLESDQEPGELEYISTNRADSDPTVDPLAERIQDDLLDHRVLIHKLVESNGQLKYRYVTHLQDLGMAGASRDFTDENLSDLLLDYVEGLGKKTSSRR